MDIMVKVGDGIITVPEGNSTFEKLVHDYLPLALSIASQYGADWQYAQDIRAAAVEGLVIAANRIALAFEPPARIATYIGAYVNSRCLDAMRTKSLVQLKHTTFFEELKETGVVPYVDIVHDADGGLMDDMPGGNGTYHDTLEDLIKELDLTDAEYNILALRLKGSTVRDIAPCVGLSFQRVGQILQDIQAKAKKLLRR